MVLFISTRELPRRSHIIVHRLYDILVDLIPPDLISSQSRMADLLVQFAVFGHFNAAHWKHLKYGPRYLLYFLTRNTLRIATTEEPKVW